ncbi:MAG: hypothetical protein HN509_02995 [Halobacteriovoraceae bacterium]|jgi:hypothetical protein|nr:hypothetical protein [Halobacteriovoraceae bacterium]MBT5095173.1 hypothetical protein [Halobacteriovoraceae bacterium]
MKKLLASALLLVSSGLFAANDYNAKSCAFVNMHKNFKVQPIIGLERGKIADTLQLTVVELNAIATVIKAFNLQDFFGQGSTLDQLLDNIDSDGISFKRLVGKKSKKTYYYLDFYAGDNAAGFIVNQNATRIVAENSDGDISCLK